jgi:uncharacterized protein DUF559
VFGRRKRVVRHLHLGIPTTPVAQILLDVAATESTRTLRAAIAEADFRGDLHRAQLDAIRGQGRPGSAALLAALDDHAPQYTHVRSELERRFLDLCVAHDIPLPEVNVEVEGLTVDALWRDACLVIELDGQTAHGSEGRVRVDRARELKLRTAGYVLHRYSWDQVVKAAEAVANDVSGAIAASVLPGRG